MIYHFLFCFSHFTAYFNALIKGFQIGFFRKNPYQSERSELELAMILCKHHEEIKSDVDGWYEKLFR
ncbi:hypothetical protein [Chryseobacterium sp. EZn1]|uniref:hypothetical protein n=1 Tax=Chryseobacterium cupriresistens TaxID=3366770 RepID=UPI0039851EA2